MRDFLQADPFTKLHLLDSHETSTTSEENPRHCSRTFGQDAEQIIAQIGLPTNLCLPAAALGSGADPGIFREHLLTKSEPATGT